ncbi:MAG: glycosyltransferase family 2 protein [Gemmatimonadaceae bacterium]
MTMTTLDHGPGILAIPAMEWIWTASAQAIAALSNALPAGSVTGYQTGPHSIAAKRNYFVRELLERPELGWLLFVDSDACPPPIAAERLLSHNVPIVAALAALRGPPFLHSHTEIIGRGPGPLLETEQTGMHTTLIRREVFERVPGPWFDHGLTPGYGEDTHFCAHVRAHGERIFVDSQFQVGHIAVLSIDNTLQDAYWQTPAGRAGIERHHAEHDRSG